MTPKKKSSTTGKIRSKRKGAGKPRSMRANTQGHQLASKVASPSLNLTFDPAYKCRISDGVASAPGVTMPSARSLRIWAARFAAGVALIKAIIEDGEPILGFVEQLVRQIVA